MIENLMKKIILLLVLSTLLLANPLSIFESYMGQIWEGHYSDSADSSLVHMIYWEYALDSSRVYQVKTVPELDFRMVTTYYWDERKEEVASLALIDDNTFAAGYAQAEKEHIECYSHNFHPEGSHETISHFLIYGGSLIDRFYRKNEGDWFMEHLVIYKPILLSEAFKLIMNRE